MTIISLEQLLQESKNKIPIFKFGKQCIGKVLYLSFHCLLVGVDIIYSNGSTTWKMQL